MCACVGWVVKSEGCAGAGAGRRDGWIEQGVGGWVGGVDRWQSWEARMRVGRSARVGGSRDQHAHAQPRSGVRSQCEVKGMQGDTGRGVFGGGSSVGVHRVAAPHKPAEHAGRSMKSVRHSGTGPALPTTQGPEIIIKKGGATGQGPRTAAGLAEETVAVGGAQPEAAGGTV